MLIQTHINAPMCGFQNTMTGNDARTIVQRSRSRNEDAEPGEFEVG